MKLRPPREDLVVTTRLNGGLGNQLFQYACGRAFALASGAQLVIDASKLQTGSPRVTRRELELDAYRIEARTATLDETSRLGQATRWGKIGARMAGLDVLTESPKLYPNVLRELQRDTVLQGFWQSENCFSAFAADIQMDLTPRRELSEKSRRVAQLIEATPSAAIHVRRGDYVNLPSAARFHGSVPLNYYQAAAQRIRARHAELMWVIFSDDIDWCRQALSFLEGATVFVDHNQGRDAWQDLYLMSLCQHQIIANSSFGWWGAWLSERRGREDQMICAPAKWFVKEDPYADFRIPKRWARL